MFTAQTKGEAMRSLIAVGVAALVLGLGVSSFAADTESVELYAVSQLTGQQSTSLPTMSDQQLRSVEGMSFSRHHDCGCGYSYRSVTISQSNWMDQANVNLGGHRGGVVDQFNGASQSNLAIVR